MEPQTQENTNQETQNPENELVQQTLKQSEPQSEKPYELQPHSEAAMCYFIPPITGIMVLVYEKKNEFVRTHAMTSIVGFIAVVLAYQFGKITEGIYIGHLIKFAALVVGVYVWANSAYKALKDEEVFIPIITPITRDLLKKL